VTNQEIIDYLSQREDELKRAGAKRYAPELNSLPNHLAIAMAYEVGRIRQHLEAN
jgi:hypothetical protein